LVLTVFYITLLYLVNSTVALYVVPTAGGKIANKFESWDAIAVDGRVKEMTNLMLNRKQSIA